MDSATLGGLAVKLLLPTRNDLRTMRPVTSFSVFDTDGEIDPKGLFSEELFGELGSEYRPKNFAYMDLRTLVIHPFIYERLCRSRKIYKEIAACRQYAVWDDATADFLPSTAELGSTGLQFLIDHLTKLTKKDPETLSAGRKSLYALIDKYEDVTLRYALVMPAGIRDVEVKDGRTEYDEVNDLYLRLQSSFSTLTPDALEADDLSTSRTRFRVQEAFFEVFSYIRDSIKGKTKLILKGVGSRAVVSGTRSVISPVIDNPEILFSPENIGGSKTVVGLFQFAAAVLPICIFKLREQFLDHVFFGDQQLVSLINPDTLKSERVTVSVKTLDRWTTIGGLERVVTGFRKKDSRHDPVLIAGRYVALVYETPKGWRIFRDIDECPAWVDRKKLRPVTLTDMLYLSLHEVADIIPSINGRYPSCEHGSIFPSFIYLKSTTTSTLKYALDHDGNPTARFARSYPTFGAKFHESMCAPSRHIQRLGADYDGDQMGLIAAFSEESIREIKALLAAKEFYVSASGKLFYSAERDTLSLLSKSLTSPLFRN